MPELLANLNPEQLAAVTLPNEPALILAGAGSGKTRVLITRIAWLIQQGMASPSTILAVTFTNKAAREMMGRLQALLPIDTRGMWIGTFHGLRIAEVPTTLSPDGRGRPPHLRSWRDGWRLLRFYLLLSPEWLFLFPGLTLAAISGAVGGLSVH